MFRQKHIRRQFERAASGFDNADFVHSVTREGLLTRLEPLLVDAKTVLDLGCATGAASQALAKRFKGSRVTSVDIAHNMLTKARARKSWLSKMSFAQASADQLPFADASVDVVFSNLLLPWLADPGLAFAEIARVLRKGGLFAFATLGPDSFQELARAWKQVDDGVHINRFPDMHNLGDGLVNAGLGDPVLDVDRLAVSYDNKQRLFSDLFAVGARNALQHRNATLTGKGRFASMLAALDETAIGGKISLDLELVFGHCWGVGPKFDPTNYRISATDIPIRRT